MDSVPVHLLWAYLPPLDGDHLEGGNSVSPLHGAFLMLAGTGIRHITAPLYGAGSQEVKAAEDGVGLSVGKADPGAVGGVCSGRPGFLGLQGPDR